ncbi:MAG TPA: DMT family transporter [Rubrobacteraceae bacterium]|nr:DMT family transporter [Rubrobacteraceae bacterium]
MVQGEARDRLALHAIAVGVLAISAAAIFIRLADAPALAVAFWRSALGAVVLLPIAVARREKLPEPRVLGWLVLSGVLLGAHFGFWISSLDYTSVAASVVLVCTAPVFVAILAYLTIGEKTSLVSFAGILVAVVGAVLIGGDRSVGSAALYGNVLALIGTVTIAVHLLIGRRTRTGGLGVLPYSIIVYSAAALTLLPAALITGERLWGYSGETWFWLFTITLGPQIMGHTVFNWALRYVEASVISATVLAEPVAAAVLAWLILSERPGLATAIGGAIVLIGLYLLIRGRRNPAAKTATKRV